MKLEDLTKQTQVILFMNKMEVIKEYYW